MDILVLQADTFLIEDITYSQAHDFNVNRVSLSKNAMSSAPRIYHKRLIFGL